jgi:hypothetical protein
MMAIYMSTRPLPARIDQIKAIKSAYLLEARKQKDRGSNSVAVALYLKAGEMELDLAAIFQAVGEAKHAQVNLLSAGSCFLLAHQYRRALDTLSRLSDEFAEEAGAMIAECKGRDDVPLLSDSSELQALIQLLLKKNVINATDWAEAIGEHG